MTKAHRLTTLTLLGCSIALLLPGIFAPVLTIRGVLTRDGIAQVAPLMLERGLNDDTVAALESMMNPSILSFLKATGGDVRTIVRERLGLRSALNLDGGGSTTMWVDGEIVNHPTDASGPRKVSDAIIVIPRAR